jgi:tripartite-type tricarboxylate transporter receptor subunit TctC
MDHRILASIAVCAALVSASTAVAQSDDYPNKPVTVIIPAAAGNSPDIAARLIANRLGEIWKQQVIIINRPGAGGLVAAEAARGAPKDGYTLYMTQASTYTVLPIMQPKMPVDLHNDFIPIGLIGEQPIAVSVSPSLGVNTLSELIELVKKTPGGMMFAATNRGSQSHLTGELFRIRANIDLTFVHAQGASASLTDVIAGRIPIMFEGIAGVSGSMKSGAVKVIAFAAEKRVPDYPDLPTVGETIPGFESKGWLALMAPAGTSENIVRKVNADLRTALDQADVKQKFSIIGTYPHALSPEETGEFIKKEEELWWPIVRQVAVDKK